MSSGVLPIWLFQSLPVWLVALVVVCMALMLYAAIRYREVRKFLAGSFFMSSGILWYLWVTGTALPIALPYQGAIAIESPEISRQRAVVHFILFLLCLYFGFFSRPRQTKDVG